MTGSDRADRTRVRDGDRASEWMRAATSFSYKCSTITEATMGAKKRAKWLKR